MRTTIDRGGRVVIPKMLRDEIGLQPGVEVEVGVRDGCVEIGPATVPMRVERRGDRVVIVSDADPPPISTAEVREILERHRR